MQDSVIKNRWPGQALRRHRGRRRLNTRSTPAATYLGLLGPNGSGKTTTMGMLLGLVKPTAGGFTVFDSDTPHLEALRRVGAIVETPSFHPYLSGRDNLAYFQGITGRADQEELDDLLEMVGPCQPWRQPIQHLLTRHEAALGAGLFPVGRS